VVFPENVQYLHKINITVLFLMLFCGSSLFAESNLMLDLGAGSGGEQFGVKYARDIDGTFSLGLGFFRVSYCDCPFMTPWQGKFQIDSWQPRLYLNLIFFDLFRIEFIGIVGASSTYTDYKTNLTSPIFLFGGGFAAGYTGTIFHTITMELMLEIDYLSSQVSAQLINFGLGLRF